MAPRTSWKGFIRLSLISVPVKAYTANNTGEDVRLNQLHKECNSRVKYKKVCPEHGELGRDDIVSGYEYAKDQYVIVEPDELDKLRPASDKSVRIEGFVEADKVDPVYYAGRTYYLTPDGAAGSKPYQLLHKGMVDAGVVAVAQVVMSGREQVVMVRPRDTMLVLSVLHVAKKVKDVHELGDQIGDETMTKEELRLTKTLIDASTIEEFEYGSFKDRYVERLQKLIQMKIEGEEIVQAPDSEEPKIINLMDALKKSVAEAQAATRGRKMAASEKKPKPKKAARKKATRKRKTG